MISDDEREQTAVRWDRRGRATVFQSPVPDTERSVSLDINRRGQVLVWSFSFDPGSTGMIEQWYLWGADGDVTALPIAFPRAVQPTTPFLGPRGDAI